MSSAQPSMFAKLVCLGAGQPSRDLIPCERARTEWGLDGIATVILTLPSGLKETVTVSDDDTCLYVTNNGGSTIETIRRRKPDAAL